MRCFIDQTPIDPRHLVGLEMHPGAISRVLLKTLRIDLARDELLALQSEDYVVLRRELQEDLAVTGEPPEPAEASVLENETFKDFLDRAPSHLGRIIEVFFWHELILLLFPPHEGVTVEYYVIELEAVSVKEAIALQASAIPTSLARARARERGQR